MDTKEKSGKPQVASIILCEKILQDVIRPDSITCVNVYNGIAAGALPVMVPVLFAFAQVTGTTSTFHYQYKITDGEGNLFSESDKQEVQAAPTPTAIHKIISIFAGLTFEKAGSYNVSLVVDDEQVASLPLVVELVEQVQQPAAQQQA